MTVKRLASLKGMSGIEQLAPCIVSGEEHRFLVQEQLRETAIPAGKIMLEPVGRNTAPTLTIAALAAMVENTDPVLVLTPAD
jgi:mannose-1-phosphate guanylyltransferase/mannose-6-phosphate isomerase